MTERHDYILIVDFGSQYTHLLARRIRELGVKSEIVLPDVSLERLQQARGIILSGGPKSVDEPDSPQVDRRLFFLGRPILGLCYGHQLMAHALGGQLHHGQSREYGHAVIKVSSHAPVLFKELPSEQTVWMSHGDSVAVVPSGFAITATSELCPVAAMADQQRQLFGLQFHPEVSHTAYGQAMLRQFVFAICQAQANWNPQEQLEEIGNDIRQIVGARSVLMLVSGGVDSTVAFALLQRVLGKERVYGLHIDSGLLRADESDQIQRLLATAGFAPLHIVRAQDQFFTALAGVVDPERKRLNIGESFLIVAEKVRQEMGLATDQWIIGQGTIYPDTIETGGTKHAQTIKTHHNRIPRLQQLISAGQVVEPLKELYKDEVRAIGKLLGLPDALLLRQPFPGPGLGIRVLCHERPWPGLSQAVMEKLRAIIAKGAPVSDWSVLPVRSVGVQGDQRSYAHALAVAGGDWQTVRSLAQTVPGEVSEINRVVWLLDGSIGSLKQEQAHPATVTPERVKRLQAVDQAVRQLIQAAGLEQSVWQMPIILLPVGAGEAVVVRPVASREAMTVQPYRLPAEVLEELKKVLNPFGLSYLFYDVTDKPPATIEWE